MPHSRYACREIWRGPLWLLLSLAVKARGKHEAVIQGPSGVDKAKTISLQLNSDHPPFAPHWGVWGFYIWSWTFPIHPIKVVPMPLPPSFFFSQICSNGLFALPQPFGYCHGLHTPLITIALDAACRAEDGGGWGGTVMFSAAAVTSLVHAFFSLPHQCHLHPSRPCPGNTS